MRAFRELFSLGEFLDSEEVESRAISLAYLRIVKISRAVEKKPEIQPATDKFVDW